jgi:hypothetical protein
MVAGSNRVAGGKVHHRFLRDPVIDLPLVTYDPRSAAKQPFLR